MFEEITPIEETPILGNDWKKLSVFDTETGTEIAEITNELVTTAGERYEVRLVPA